MCVSALLVCVCVFAAVRAWTDINLTYIITDPVAVWKVMCEAYIFYALSWNLVKQVWNDHTNYW